MGTYREIDGDLIKYAKEGLFDVIAHGTNCFLTMRAGIAPQIAAAFPEAEEADNESLRGDVNKLGTFSYGVSTVKGNKSLYVINIYSQYNAGKPGPGSYNIPLDYDALLLAFRKINYVMKDEEFKTIGLPQIGCGLAGGDWDIVKTMIQEEFTDVDVTVVIYK